MNCIGKDKWCCCTHAVFCFVYGLENPGLIYILLNTILSAIQAVLSFSMNPVMTELRSKKQHQRPPSSEEQTLLIKKGRSQGISSKHQVIVVHKTLHTGKRYSYAKIASMFSVKKPSYVIFISNMFPIL